MLHGRRPRTHAYLLLIGAPGVVRRLPGNPGVHGDQGDPMYLHHAFGAKVTREGLWVNQRSFPRNVPGGCPLWSRTPLQSFVAWNTTVCLPCSLCAPMCAPPSDLPVFFKTPVGYHRDGFVQRGSPHASIPAWSFIQDQQERCLQTARHYHRIC